MVNENIDFDDFLAPPKTITIEGRSGNKQQFVFYPLPFDYMPKIWALFRRMSSARIKNPDIAKLDTQDLYEVAEELFELLDKDTIHLLKELVTALVKHNIKKLDESKRDRFCHRYWFTLYPLMFELHMPMMDEQGMSPEMQEHYEDFMKKLDSKSNESTTTKSSTGEQAGPGTIPG